MPTLTSYGSYFTEHRTRTSPWSLLNRGTEEILTRTTVRSVSTRRVKPVGVDLLFQGVPYSHSTVIRSSPTVPFGPTSFGSGGTQYRGEHSCRWFLTSQARVYLDTVYPNTYIDPYEVPSKASTNDLRNLIADQKADLLTNIAEYKQTVAMFKEGTRILVKDTSEYAQDVQKTIRRYNRIGWGIPGSVLTRKLANLHLAYVFGVRPLVQDICGVFEVLTASDPRRVFRNRMITGVPSVIRTRTFMGGNYTEPNAVTIVTRQTSARYKYIVYGEMGPITNWHQYAQLGLNPVATAWELVPWSFAIDRFIQIGSALQSMTALAGLTRAVAYERLQVEHKAVASHPYGECSTLQRINSRTGVALTWAAPRIQNTFGANQVVTYTALLRQQLTKLSPLFK